MTESRLTRAATSIWGANKLLESNTDTRKFLRELFGLFLLFWALLLLLSLVSFDANDESFNHIASNRGIVQNKAGLFGAYAAGFLNDFFGLAAYIWPLVFAALGAAYVSASYTLHWWRWCGFFLLTICFLVASSALDWSVGDLAGGGMVGAGIQNNAQRYLSPVGSSLAWLFLFLIGLELACNFSWFSLLESSFQKLRLWIAKRKEQANSAEPGLILHPDRPEDSTRRKEPWLVMPSAAQLRTKLLALLRKFFTHQQPEPKALPALLDIEPISRETSKDAEQTLGFEGKEADNATPKSARYEPQSVTANLADKKEDDYPKEATEQPLIASALSLKKKKARIPLPGIDLLSPASPSANFKKEDLEAKGQALMSCLKDFDIQGQLVRITPGPLITMYEVRPAPGIRVNRIASLSDDLSLALKAIAIRIQAPIPGSDTVGIEIPNSQRQTVNFRELASSQAFRQGAGPLTMILGKDIAGRPYLADLAKMPHLLVAGATGAGKSVCLNGILISLLLRMRPEEMRLLLVDPKHIEMAVYADTPHLIHPVVTEINDAKNALNWAVHEMERRYKALARLCVRNIAAYNQKLAAFKQDLPPDFADLESMPYLVIVIDELADLIMTASREVEASIVRLAQKARACGIHLILATQRPSVDVVTGLIKTNFPCRISFQVTSGHDSKTILDQTGAEHLLGKGDMLFKPSGGQLQRLHGPFLSDDEVQAVVNYWKKQGRPEYCLDFSQWEEEGKPGHGAGSDSTQDVLYQEAREFVIEKGHASISLIQRRFQIGFNRAARIMEQLEREKIIGPADGSKPRKIVH